MLLILLGAQLFSTGLLGDMLIRQRMEERPGYEVQDVVAPSMREVA
jgi:hypothetical protein